MRRLLALAILVAVPLAGQQTPQLALRRVPGALVQPLGIVNAGDSRLFILQQRGQIMISDGTQVLATPFLNIQSITSCCGERGLLGLAFHPRYSENGFFFVYYTSTSGDLTLARYRVSSDRDRADATSGVILFTIPHPLSNHNGGQLQFGSDGFLYIGIGDGGGAGDPSNNAQNLSSLLGKLLRIDVNTTTYSIPPSNPFVGRAGARGEIWAYGLRNPWRFSFDRLTRDLWIADVGQNLYEEINLQPATSSGGENYGWRAMEGTHCFNPTTNCRDNTMTLPVGEYSHADGSCSVTGGYRYRGVYARMRGIYFFADYCTGMIWGASESNGSWSLAKLLDTRLAITSFGEDQNGELYLVDQAGGLYQVTDQVPARHRAVRH